MFERTREHPHGAPPSVRYSGGRAKKLADLDPLVFLKEDILVGAEADVLLLVGPAYHVIIIRPTICMACVWRPMRRLCVACWWHFGHREQTTCGWVHANIQKRVSKSNSTYGKNLIRDRTVSLERWRGRDFNEHEHDPASSTYQYKHRDRDWPEMERECPPQDGTVTPGA